jgi:hypothetical protein
MTKNKGDPQQNKWYDDDKISLNGSNENTSTPVNQDEEANGYYFKRYKTPVLPGGDDCQYQGDQKN